MQITVLSGKGGTGKTTVATNLALSLDNVQLLDTDVEEPDDYIFIKPDFDKSYEAVVEDVPLFDRDKCTACRKCVDFCEYNALSLVREQVKVFYDICHSCGGCWRICPEGAISKKSRERGKIRGTQVSKQLEFWQGELNIGEQSAVPVISQLKKHIKQDKNVLIDAPPGTTCPTIEALTGSDYCLLVTEPSPFGLNDLKMAIEIVQQIDISFGVVINRSQREYDVIIEDYCQKEEIQVLFKIPYERTIAELYSAGIPFIEEKTDWKDKFKSLFARIKEEVGQ